VVVSHSRLQTLGTLEGLFSSACTLVWLPVHQGVLAYRRAVTEVVEGGSFDGLVMLDGAMRSVHAAENEILQESLRLLRAARAADIPVMAVGLGAELLASVLGARTWEGRTRGRLKEWGWVRVGLTERGKVDPAFRGFHELEPVFAWHEDSFDLPEGAWRLAGNSDYPNQAFRHGRMRYGLQFHLEVTAQMVAAWAERYADARERGALQAEGGSRGVDLDEIVEKAARYCVKLEEKAQVFGRHFVWLVEQARAERRLRAEAE